MKNIKTTFALAIFLFVYAYTALAYPKEAITIEIVGYLALIVTALKMMSSDSLAKVAEGISNFLSSKGK